jgi:uncharacterized membrane protein
VWAGVFSTLAVLRHRSFETGRFDLGNMTQAVWSTAHGEPLAATSLEGEQFTRLGAHFDPILALLAPLWIVWPSPEALVVLQAVALALGAVPVFALARRRLGSERAALALAAAYLLVPALGWTALADFHPVALATPLLLAAFLFLDADRLLPFAVAAGLAMATKEHVGLAVAGLGAWDALARGRRREGAVIAAVGTAVSLLATLVVVPHFRPEGTAGFAGRLESPALELRDLGYLLALLAPLAFLPLAAPLAAAGALPEIGLNLLSETQTQTSIRHHYSSVALAFLVAATVIGCVRIRVGTAAAPAAALVGALVLGPLVPGRLAASIVPDDHDAAAAEAVALVPTAAVVSATNGLGAHLSARRRLLSFPLLADATWVAVDTEDPSVLDRARDERGFAAALARLRADPEWRVVYTRDGVLVLTRESSAAPGTG